MLRRISQRLGTQAWRLHAASSESCTQRQWGAVRSTWVDSRGYEHFGQRGDHTRVYALIAGGSTALGYTYYLRSLEEVPYTHRKHAIMFVTPAMEKAIGEHTFQEVKSQATAQGHLLPQNSPAVHLVKRVGMRIAKVASDGSGGGYYQHMKNQQWEFAVVDEPTVNAFVAPGGKVVVYSGLLKLMTSEDELAAVLAHETAHVLARHHGERLSQMQLAGTLNLLTSLFLGFTLPTSVVVLGVFFPYSRAAENEADAIGVRLMAEACYDPRANITMLGKLEANEHKGGPTPPTAILSTHPLTEERIQRVKALLPEAETLYNERCSALQQLWVGSSLQTFMGAEGF